MSKTVAFKMPVKPANREADDWVGKGVEQHLQVRSEATEAPAERMKRLTIDVSESLHARIKIGCAKQHKKIADEVRALLERHFSDES